MTPEAGRDPSHWHGPWAVGYRLMGDWRLEFMPRFVKALGHRHVLGMQRVTLPAAGTDDWGPGSPACTHIRLPGHTYEVPTWSWHSHGKRTPVLSKWQATQRADAAQQARGMQSCGFILLPNPAALRRCATCRYVLQWDDDSYILGTMPFNVVERMDTGGHKLAAWLVHDEPTAVTWGLPELTKYFLMAYHGGCPW